MNVNGLTLRNIVEFKGHEGEPCFMGNIYIGATKIAEWSQDSHGAIIDNLRMEPEFDEDKLRDKITEFNGMTSYTYAGEEYNFDYTLEDAMCDILTLRESENSFWKALKSGYDGVVELHSNHNVNSFFVKKDIFKMPDQKIKEMLTHENEKTMADVSVHRFISPNDFNKGTVIAISDIRADAKEV